LPSLYIALPEGLRGDKELHKGEERAMIVWDYKERHRPEDKKKKDAHSEAI